MRCFSSLGWLGNPGIRTRLTAPPGLSQFSTPYSLLAPRHPPHALNSLATLFAPSATLPCRKARTGSVLLSTIQPWVRLNRHDKYVPVSSKARAEQSNRIGYSHPSPRLASARRMLVVARCDFTLSKLSKIRRPSAISRLRSPRPLSLDGGQSSVSTSQAFVSLAFASSTPEY